LVGFALFLARTGACTQSLGIFRFSMRALSVFGAVGNLHAGIRERQSLVCGSLPKDLLVVDLFQANDFPVGRFPVDIGATYIEGDGSRIDVVKLDDLAQFFAAGTDRFFG
jgi:hypothetical protein